MEKSLFEKYNVPVDEKKLLLFNNYYTDLIEKNKVMNLTAITEKEQVYLKHFIDSVLPIKNLKRGAKILDIGTGAGFPGVPLKIVEDSFNVVLLDSLNKRVEFLKEEITKLGLTNIMAIHSRAEDYANVSRETFDYVVSRAVARLNTLLEYCLPFVKVGGIFIAYKSVNTEEEIKESQNALNILGGKIEKIETADLDGNMRTLIFIKKVKETPKKYPRGQNKPKNQPL